MKKIVLGITLIGIGSFAMAQKYEMNPEKKAAWKAKKAEMHQKHMDNMKQELALSDQQVSKINALHERKKTERNAQIKQNEALRAERKAQMEEKRTEMDNEMKSILNPTQYTKWQTMRKERMSQKKHNFQNRKGDFKGMKKRGHRMKKEM